MELGAGDRSILISARSYPPFIRSCPLKKKELHVMSVISGVGSIHIREGKCRALLLLGTFCIVAYY